MERYFKQLFLDDDDNIYLVDNLDILYIYDNSYLFPFSIIMKNIKKCFRMYDYYFIHHDRTITIFNSQLNKTNIPGDSWITRKIDKVCYHRDKNIIATLENNELFVNANVVSEQKYILDHLNNILNSIPENIIQYDDVIRACLSRSEHIKICAKNISFNNIKIIDDFLLALEGDIVNLFYLDIPDIPRYSSFPLSGYIFDCIYRYDQEIQIFHLINGGYIGLDGQYYLNKLSSDVDNNLVFINHHIYLSIDDSHLFCWYLQDREADVQKIIKLLPSTEPSIINISDTQNMMIAQVRDSVSIIYNNNLQILIINGQYYIIDKKLEHIKFEQENIDYDTIISVEKSDVILSIDIDINQSILSQMMIIIPSLYRLNSDINYQFEQISNNQVISYGQGVTRQTFTNLRKELESELEKKFEGRTVSDAFQLGKIFYFCHIDGDEKFNHIHPYFFLKLSTKYDYLYLLKTFKGNHYLQQLIEYVECPEILKELDLDIENIDQYMTFIITSDLTSEQRSLYDNFIDGFLNFFNRNHMFQLIKHLPVNFFVNGLITSDNYRASFNFSINNETVNQIHFNQFKTIFESLYDDLSIKQKLCFSQNITGSQYYAGFIYIVFDYRDNCEIKSEDWQENSFEPYLEINENEPDIYHVNESIEDHISSLDYQISTCYAQLFININPTRQNVSQLLELLTIDDITLKN